MAAEASIAMRPIAAADRDRLREIFREAVRISGPQHYSAERVASWMLSADDLDAWNLWMSDGSGWVATDAHDRAIGVAMLRPSDYVHLLYVDPDFHRRGIASALLAAVERSARAAGSAELTADASLISHPVFLRAGYEVVRWEEVERRGQLFRRARMAKSLR